MTISKYKIDIQALGVSIATAYLATFKDCAEYLVNYNTIIENMGITVEDLGVTMVVSPCEDENKEIFYSFNLEGVLKAIEDD